MGGRNMKKNIFKSRKFKKVVAIALTVATTTTLGNGGVYKSVSGVENASKPELWYRYPSNPNTFKECFKLFNLCFYRNVVKDSVDKIINWFKK